MSLPQQNREIAESEEEGAVGAQKWDYHDMTIDQRTSGAGRGKGRISFEPSKRHILLTL